MYLSTYSMPEVGCSCVICCWLSSLEAMNLIYLHYVLQSCQQQQSFREKVNKVALTGKDVNIGLLGPRREVSHLLSSANVMYTQNII